MARGSKRKSSADCSSDPAAVIQSLRAKRTNPSTKKTYSSKIGIMTRWLAQHYPAAVSTSTMELVVPVANDAVLAFFGHLCGAADACDKGNVHADELAKGPMSVSCVESYRSALVDQYRSRLLTLDPQLDMELGHVLEGYEKQINGLKKRGLMKVNEGKRHLKSSGFYILAVKLMKDKPEKKGQSWAATVFMWSYFVLMWNLMSRSDSIDTIMLQYIEWAEDCLVVEEQGHKADQTGADKFGKHVYANPYEPATCPILALAVLLFSYPERSDRSRQQLFVGTDNKNRFGRVLRRMVASLDENELQILGCDGEDIGTHSLRKGSSTYALGQVGGPNPVAVYLRMGQSLGKLKDRYIHFAEGADQLCGRMIAGLPFDSDQFGVLPPHFDTAVRKELTQEYWSHIVAGYEHYPRGMQAAFPYLLASIIHHEQFLRTELDANHPVFSARVFSANPLIELLRGAPILVTGYCAVTGLKATGIPPHLAIAKRVNELATALKDVKDKLDTLDIKLSDTLPSQVAAHVVRELKADFVVNGVAPVTLRDLDSKIDGLRSSIIDQIRRSVAESLPVPASSHDTLPNPQPVWASWDWSDGQIAHSVPQQWEFPTGTTVKAMWNLWQFGDRSTGIRPYRQLSAKHDIIAKHRMRHSRAKVVMTAVEQIARRATCAVRACVLTLSCQRRLHLLVRV